MPYTPPFALLVVGVAWALLLATPAQAAGDPTRPPAFAAAPSGAAPRSAAAAASAVKPAPPPLLLGAVQVGRDGAASALLDGQVVRVGDKVGDSSVTQIDSQGVTLRGPKGPLRITLLQVSGKVASSNPNSGVAGHNTSPTVSAGGSKP